MVLYIKEIMGKHETRNATKPERRSEHKAREENNYATREF
jgi:hypothetical protein